MLNPLCVLNPQEIFRKEQEEWIAEMGRQQDQIVRRRNQFEEEKNLILKEKEKLLQERQDLEQARSSLVWLRYSPGIIGQDGSTMNP